MTNEISLKVKSLYEQFPYPARNITSEKHLLNYPKWLLPVFKQKNLNFFKGKKILEAGCGTGELSNGLALLGANVTGIDFSLASLKKARGLEKQFNTGAKFKEANLLDFDLNEKFDLIVSLGAVHHTAKPELAFHNIVNHLRPNALLALGLYNSFGRLRLRLKRIPVNFLAGNDFNKKIEWAIKLYYGGKMSFKGINWVADKFAHPHEVYYSINEIKNWFKKEGIEFIECKPKIQGNELITQIKWFLQKKGAFFVMSGKKLI